MARGHTETITLRVLVDRLLAANKTLPDYALSSAIKAWYKTGTYGCFCGFERIRSQGRPEPCFQVGQHHPRQLDEAVMHTRPALSRLG
jgi:hypothetical protein